MPSYGGNFDGIPTGFCVGTPAGVGGIPTSSELAHIGDVPRNLHNPFASFVRGVEADVLYVLCHNPLFESATTIAHQCGRSRSEVRVVLNFLVATEVVSEFRDGGRRWFHLNRHHPLHNELVSMGKSFRKRDLPRTAHALDAVDERAL